MKKTNKLLFLFLALSFLVSFSSFAAEPVELPSWDTSETDTLDPGSTRKSDGWIVTSGIPEKPSFRIFNHWQNNVYKWTAWFQEKFNKAHFDSVASMQASTTLSIGDVVQTTAYYSILTIGSARYEIVAAGAGTADGGAFIDLSGSGLQARLIQDGPIRISQYGASPGSLNNETYIIAANTYCSANNRTLWIDEDTTFITKPFTLNCDLAGTGTIQCIAEYDISGDTSATGQTIDWTGRYGVLSLGSTVTVRDITIDSNNAASGIAAQLVGDGSKFMNVTMHSGIRSNTFIVGVNNFLFSKCIVRNSGLGGNDTPAHQAENTSFADGIYARSSENMVYEFNEVYSFPRNGIVSEGDNSTGVSKNPRMVGNYIHTKSTGFTADFAGIWIENTLGGDVSHNNIVGMKAAAVTNAAWGVAFSGISAATKTHPSFDADFTGGYVAQGNIIEDCNGGFAASGADEGHVLIDGNDIKDYHYLGIQLSGDSFSDVDIINNTFGSRVNDSTDAKEFDVYFASAASGLSSAFILVQGDFNLVNIEGNTFNSTNFQNGTSHIQMSNFALRKVRKLIVRNNTVKPWTIEADATEQNGLLIETPTINDDVSIINQDLWIGTANTGINAIDRVNIDNCLLYGDGDYGNSTISAKNIIINKCRSSFITGSLTAYILQVTDLTTSANLTYSNNDFEYTVGVKAVKDGVQVIRDNIFRNSTTTVFQGANGFTNKTKLSDNVLLNHVLGGYLVDAKDASDQVVLLNTVRDTAAAIVLNSVGATVQTAGVYDW